MAEGPLNPIRIVLADDHAVVRSALRALLEGEDDLVVVAEAGDGDAAEDEAKRHAPEILLLDLNMPGRSSLDLIAKIASSGPETQVVVLTMENQPGLVREALDAGARGYILKQAADRELVAAIRAVAAGEVHVQSELTDGGSESVDSPDSLTPREVEVLGLIALGHTSSEVASALNLSARTVESHRAHIHQKLRIEGRPDLVKYALDRGLIPLEDAADQ